MYCPYLDKMVKHKKLPPAFSLTSFETVNRNNVIAQSRGYKSVSFADVANVMPDLEADRKVIANNFHFQFPTLRDLTNADEAEHVLKSMTRETYIEMYKNLQYEVHVFAESLEARAIDESLGGFVDGPSAIQAPTDLDTSGTAANMDNSSHVRLGLDEQPSVSLHPHVHYIFVFGAGPENP